MTKKQLIKRKNKKPKTRKRKYKKRTRYHNKKRNMRGGDEGTNIGDTCSICYDNIIEDVHNVGTGRIIFQCNLHHFCSPCTSTMYSNMVHSGNSLNCPTCRRASKPNIKNICETNIFPDIAETEEGTVLLAALPRGQPINYDRICFIITGTAMILSSIGFAVSLFYAINLDNEAQRLYQQLEQQVDTLLDSLGNEPVSMLNVTFFENQQNMEQLFDNYRANILGGGGNNGHYSMYSLQITKNMVPNILKEFEEKYPHLKKDTAGFFIVETPFPNINKESRTAMKEILNQTIKKY